MKGSEIFTDEQQEEFIERNWDLYQMFGYFALDADFNKFDDDKTLDQYVGTGGPISVRINALSQAKEVLQMDPFPETLIEGLTNRCHPEITRKQWLQEVVTMLERKLKEQGFFNAEVLPKGRG